MEQTPVGKVGRLVHPTRGTDGPGEVRLAIRGGTELFIAWSADPLPAQAEVLVIGERGPRSVEVEPWDSGLPA